MQVCFKCFDKSPVQIPENLHKIHYENIEIYFLISSKFSKKYLNNLRLNLDQSVDGNKINFLNDIQNMFMR